MSKYSFVNELSVGKSSQVVSNPYSGQSVELTALEVAVYDYIKGAEMIGQYKGMQNGIDWFIKNNVKAYMTLLN